MANEKFKLKGNNKIPDYDSEVEVDVDNKYEAYSKDIPEPTQYQGITIIWFNAFGVREKSNRKDANVSYKVTLQAPLAGQKLYALYGSGPHELKTEDDGPSKVKFTLDVGDPPIGMG